MCVSYVRGAATYCNTHDNTPPRHDLQGRFYFKTRRANATETQWKWLDLVEIEILPRYFPHRRAVRSLYSPRCHKMSLEMPTTGGWGGLSCVFATLSRNKSITFSFTLNTKVLIFPDRGALLYYSISCGPVCLTILPQHRLI